MTPRRNPEALPLLLTLSSGVKGFTTIHAGSARQALSRLRFICQLSDAGSELPMTALNSLVSESIDIVVHCARQNERVEITEVIAVEDQQAGPESAAFTATTIFHRERPGLPLTWSGALPARATIAFTAAGISVAELLDTDGSETRS